MRLAHVVLTLEHLNRGHVGHRVVVFDIGDVEA